MEDEGDRLNEDFKKKEDRRQQKLLMKNKSVADRAKASAEDALTIIKKIVTEMPPAVLVSAEEKHKSNPFNVRVDVNEIASRMEEVAKAEKTLKARRKQMAKLSDDSENEDDDEVVDDAPMMPSAPSLKSGEGCGTRFASHHFTSRVITCHITSHHVTSHVTNSSHNWHLTSYVIFHVADGPPLDENGNPLPQKAFTMILGGNQARLNAYLSSFAPASSVAPCKRALVSFARIAQHVLLRCPLTPFPHLRSR